MSFLRSLALVVVLPLDTRNPLFYYFTSSGQVPPQTAPFLSGKYLFTQPFMPMPLLCLPLGIKGGRRPIFHQKKLFIARPQETDSLRQLQVNLQNREEGYLISKVNRSRNQNRTRKQGVDPLLLTMVEGMPLFQCVLTTSQEQRQRLRGNTFRSRRGMRTTGEQFSDEGTDPLFSQSFGFTDQKKKQGAPHQRTDPALEDTDSIDPRNLHLLALDTNPRECAIPFSLAHMHVLFLIRYGYPSASCFRFFYI